MKSQPFNPTSEQMMVISHAGSAFVAACPGSGKTRVLVERARRLLALLIYAQSADILVPTWVIRRLYEEVYEQ